MTASLLACSEPAPDQAPRLRSVRYVEVSDVSGAVKRTFSGQVKASDESDLSFQVGGRVQELLVKMGDRVKAGQVLARLDPTDFEIELQQARASLSQLQAESRSADSTYKRTKRLFENKNASVSDLDTARAQRDSAASAVAAQYQVVRSLQRQLGYATLEAKADGVVREVDVEATEVVSAGQSIGVLQSGDELEVDIDMPEVFINRFGRGKKVQVVLTTMGDKLVEGEVSEIGVAGLSKVAYPVTIRLLKRPEGLEVGMAANVVFEFEPLSEGGSALTVPTTAVGEDREGTFVFLIEQSESDKAEELGTVRRQGVQTGRIETTGIEVLSGVQPGQRVVTAGVSRIFEGLKVKVPKKQESFDQ
ncbi:MAG: efflux RND transporter periplasmic adaptor subunit [Myxococcota bacterium]